MKAGTPPPEGPETACFGGTGRRLLGDFVGALPSVVLRGFNCVSTLAAQDAHEASDRVLLPAGRFHNLGQRHALGALHQRDDLGLLVAPLRSLAALLGCCARLCRLGLLASLRWLGLFGRLRWLASRLRLCGFLFGASCDDNRRGRASSLFLIRY